MLCILHIRCLKSAPILIESTISIPKCKCDATKYIVLPRIIFAFFIENIIKYQTLSLNSSYDAYHLLSIFKEFKDYIQYRVAIDPSLDYDHLMSWLHKLKNDAIPTSLSELKFNGYDAQKVGYKGIAIKNILNELLELCMKEKLSNEYSDLRSYAKRKLNS